MVTTDDRLKGIAPDDSTRTRHSADDALDEREYHLLVEGTYQMDRLFGLQARFAIVCMGRLGLRVGELIHMNESWVDRRRGMITIPRQDPCKKGKDGGICGYCTQLAEQAAEHNDRSAAEDAAHRWRAKTDAAARSVPFRFHAPTEITVERFFEEWSKWPVSKTGVNRRLQRAIDSASDDVPKDFYPHALRATAASWHASRGLDALSLQALLGWSDLSTAHRYVRRSGERTQRALESTHYS